MCAVVEELERRALLASSADAARFLQDSLGQRLTGYLCGLKDVKQVGRWASGTAEPRDLAKLRLRTAFHAALLLVEAYGRETAASWFVGTNSVLDDEAPAWVLRHGEDIEALRLVVPAAKSAASAGLARRGEAAGYLSGRSGQDSRDGRTLPENPGVAHARKP